MQKFAYLRSDQRPALQEYLKGLLARLIRSWQRSLSSLAPVMHDIQTFSAVQELTKMRTRRDSHPSENQL